MDPFVQNMAEQQGYSRFPSPDGSPMLTHPARPYVDPLAYQPQQRAKSMVDPNAQAMMMAVQKMAEKRKAAHWPDSGATVVHPGTGEVVSAQMPPQQPIVAAARD